jgi:hypothetical protein
VVVTHDQNEVACQYLKMIFVCTTRRKYCSGVD